MSSPDDRPLLEGRSLTKRFPGVLALDGVDFTLSRGEVLAVIGENGAGKSTLMKILAGVQEPDSGEILVYGRPERIDSVRTAEGLGIALIHQELNLSDNLDVAANVFLGREPHRFGMIDRARIERDTQAILDRLGLECPPDTLVSDLSIGHQQLVEIAKALSVNAKVIIMDEPTSSLSQGETERLFKVVHGLREKDVSVIYISHRLGEVKELADRVCVLRDGRNSGGLAREEIDHDAMIRLMVGRDLANLGDRASHTPGEPVLSVRDLCTPAHPARPLTFEVCAGEIVGVAGLVGAGRTELLETLFGITPPEGGTIAVSGAPLRAHAPADAIRAGMALVPEDRKQQGLILEMAVRENLSLPALHRRRRACGFLDFEAERRTSSEMIGKLSIKTPHDRQIVQFLSGGNQQKVVLGKWLDLEPRLLLLDEPTRGVDVGAKDEIYRLMEDLASRGVAILFVSSEMEEVLRMSDRALVMHQGWISGELARADLGEEAVMRLATGRPAA